MLYPIFGNMDKMNDLIHMKGVERRSNPGKFFFSMIIFTPLTSGCQKERVDYNSWISIVSNLPAKSDPHKLGCTVLFHPMLMHRSL